MDSKLIEVLSFILPFANEVANVLTTSGLPIFKNLYRPCIDPYLIDDKIKIKKDKICKLKYTLHKMIIDLIALTGIIILIAKNAINNGFLEAILVGLTIVFLSFIFPNLFMHQIIHFLTKKFNIKSKYGILAIGFFIILVLLFISYMMEKIIENNFSDRYYNIDSN